MITSVRDEPTVSERLAEFVVTCPESAMPSGARAIVGRAAVDTLGCAIAGSSNTIGEMASAVLAAGVPRDYGATLWSGVNRATLLEACAVNATLSHTLDFDDTNHPLHGHPSCHLIPTVVSVAENRNLRGHEAVSAYLIGHEVEVALARALNMSHFDQGFHPTGTLGTFGACAAACRLLGLGVGTTTNAFAVAASLSAGVRANVGTMIKPLHAGMAAAHGVEAALLAEAGWIGSRDALERPVSGYVASHATLADAAFDAAFSTLAVRWAIMEPHGYQVKQFPSCGATQAPSEAAVRIHDTLSGVTSDIVSIDVGVTQLAMDILVYDRPTSGSEARFSLTHAVARPLLTGPPTLDDFADDRVRDEALVPLLEKVRYYADPSLVDNTEYGCVLKVTLSDGNSLEVAVDSATGNSDNPLSESALAEKFYGCLGDKSAEAISLHDAWSTIDSAMTVRQILEPLRIWRSASAKRQQ